MASRFLSYAARSQLHRGSIRRFADATAASGKSIARRPVSMEERAANRAARKERATKFIAQARGTPVEEGASTTAATTTSTTAAAGRSVLATKW